MFRNMQIYVVLCVGVWLHVAVCFFGGRVMVTGMGTGAMCVVLRLSVVFL